MTTVDVNAARAARAEAAGEPQQVGLCRGHQFFSPRTTGNALYVRLCITNSGRGTDSNAPIYVK